MRWQKLFLFLSMTTVPAAALLLGFSAGPHPQFTGGFREGTCIDCHNSYRLNQGRTMGGVFEIRGIPRNYEAGQAYAITVVIGHPGQRQWGFEFTARHTESATQAGRLVPTDTTTQVKTASNIQYLMHTKSGTRRGTVDGPVEFQFRWEAPDPSAGPVLFNAAGNAADGSDTPQGDYIYTASGYSAVPESLKGIPTTVSARRETGAVERMSEMSRLMNLPMPVDLNRGSVEILIQHRFFQALEDSRPGNAFGIDSGANINLGVNYGVTDRFSAGVSRARLDQIIAFSGTYELQTRRDSPWKVSLHAGIEGKRNFQRQFSPFVQAAASYDYRALRLHAVPTVVFNSRPDTQVRLFPARAIHPDSDHTFSLGVGADVALNSRFSLSGEYVPRLAGFGGFDRTRPQVGGGFSIRTASHVFQILVATSWDFTPSLYAVNANRSEVSLGFNIYRRIR